MRRRLVLAAIVLGALSCGAARAGCSREINVPVAPVGASIIVNGGAVGGIYPEVLDGPAAKAGCKLVYTIVPRARQAALFEIGKADLLLPATRTPARDRHGTFVPLIGHRATLISLAGTHAPITSAQDLLDRTDLRVAVVRGYDFGEHYQALVAELAKQGRLFREVDTIAIARLMQAGAIDVTIMGPTNFAGAVAHEPRLAALGERLRIEPIPELPWNLAGVYVSHRSLTPADQAILRELLENLARSPAVIEAFQRHHRPDVLAESVRPR
ncbi:substrate-binding periplasmic protein [Pseudoduganella namucuonensis]|uniref:Amino acid ABC transporter substrate-binding protein, PAAT family n=1 Tax=Pseudoduganella namucuonensis TaxID=1035707 RepID=A0A1I7GSC9_9BURK|nr:transporter substrate-binding domain-containing protein [Pseudoduganella namucuonensis]SFU51358.1 amino acid ABC transporter substrate-binding protein, PAAT family [Pseudoduganella namucuonensis]